MPDPVSLQAVTEEMDMIGGEANMIAFLNRQTGELFGGTEDQIATAEENDDDEGLPDWEVEMIQRLREVLQSADWLELPRRGAHADYAIIERFCHQLCDGPMREELLSALKLKGRGVFRRFKDILHRRGIEEQWYKFRRDQLAKEAEAWLKAHEIAFVP
jgi:hypothetical protein